MILRDLTAADIPLLVELNNANVPAVSPSDADGMAALLALAESAIALAPESEPREVRAFALLMRPGSSYGSENYRWFEQRGTDFLYVDRIVVADDAQNQGVGQQLYAAIFEAARAHGAAEVTCEVNLDPPNPGSMRFHERLGFAEVGRQSTKGETIVVSMLAAPTQP